MSTRRFPHTLPAAGRLGLLGLVVLLGTAGLNAFAPATCRAEARPRMPHGRPVVVFEDHKLTVRAEDVPLETLLDKISRLSKVAILMVRGAGREPVSVQLEGFPLDEALRRLLKDHDAFFYYGVEHDRPASLSVVWVYPRGRGRGLMPVPPEAWASTKDLEDELGDADPATRARAFEAVIQRKGERARDQVLRALADPDGRVRSRALYTALRARLDFPVELLTRLALEDSVSHVRFLALEALGTKPTIVRPIATRAMNDPDPHVRNKAQEILKVLDRAARRARGAGQSSLAPTPHD